MKLTIPTNKLALVLSSMHNLVIVDPSSKAGLELENATVVSAREYLVQKEFGEIRSARVYNFCKSLTYQSLGYYVSLLAAARGHRPLPSISTLLDMKNVSLVRFVSDDIDTLIQKSLKAIQGPNFTLSIYFGRNLAKRYDKLAKTLFNVFPAPFFQAKFKLTDRWQLSSIRTLSFGDIDEEHLPFAMDRVCHYFQNRTPRAPARKPSRYSLAILYNPADPTCPSNERAIEKFKSSAEDKGLFVDIIDRSDYGRIAQYDALFIRETTGVNHHTFRFARKAQAEDLVVIDDADSILKCTNKVFLAELFQRHGIPAPRTLVVHRRNTRDVLKTLGLPLVLKKPDSSFSLGVKKIASEEDYLVTLPELLHESDLIIAQEYFPTSYDWRIGVLAGRPLFACKYHMAPLHWQIARRSNSGKVTYGDVEAIPFEDVPAHVIKLAVSAARLIGSGLYGVDIKEKEDKSFVIEINENPNIDSGQEDSLLKDELYSSVVDFFLARLDARTNGSKS